MNRLSGTTSFRSSSPARVPDARGRGGEARPGGRPQSFTRCAICDTLLYNARARDLHKSPLYSGRPRSAGVAEGRAGGGGRGKKRRKSFMWGLAQVRAAADRSPRVRTLGPRGPRSFSSFFPPPLLPPPRPSRFSPSRTRSAFPSSEREVARTPRFQRFPYTSETATRGSPRSSKMSPSRGGRSALAGERLPRSYDGEGSYSLRDFSRADLKSDLACTFYIRRAPSLGMEARGCECRDPGGRYSKALLGVFNPRPHVGLVVRVSATCRRNISQAARAHLSRAPYRNRRICTD
jgi:hypothetical protein